MVGGSKEIASARGFRRDRDIPDISNLRYDKYQYRRFEKYYRYQAGKSRYDLSKLLSIKSKNLYNRDCSQDNYLQDQHITIGYTEWAKINLYIGFESWLHHLNVTKDHIECPGYRTIYQSYCLSKVKIFIIEIVAKAIIYKINILLLDISNEQK